MEENNLTDEQKKFLEECEKEFEDRYTEKDIEFMKIKNLDVETPPINPHYTKVRTYYNVEFKSRKRHL